MQEKYLNLAKLLASQLGVTVEDTQYIISLLNAGIYVPVINKYYKTKIKNISLRNIRLIANALQDLHDLETRRNDIIADIKSQGKLTNDLQDLLENAINIQDLENIYLPYRVQRQTKALIATQRGLDSLANALISTYPDEPELLAHEYVNDDKGVLNNKMAMEGARQILLEKFGEDLELLKQLRKQFAENAVLQVVNSKARNDNNKYKEFANYSQAITQVPTAKLFTIFEGRRDNFLKVKINFPDGQNYAIEAICNVYKLDKVKVSNSPWLTKLLQDAWSLKLFPKLETDILHELRDIAGDYATRELTVQLRNLLYMQGAGKVVTIGLVPNAKSGVAVAVIDEFGNYLDSCMLFPVGIQGDWYQSLAYLAKLVIKYNVSLLTIANLSGYREIERLGRHLKAMYPDLKLDINILDAYALMEYADTEHAKQECVGLELGCRAAVSLARRGQNPLAEFAKISAKDFGKMQHDFWSGKYQAMWEQLLEDTICNIGVDINQVDEYTLSKLPGMDLDLAKKIITYRTTNGNFKSRVELKSLLDLDLNNNSVYKAEITTSSCMENCLYDQFIGFVYVHNGDNVLDALNIHPNSYYIVEKIAQYLNIEIANLLTNTKSLEKLNLNDLVDAKHDIESIKNIISELKQPSVDPRGKFKLPRFAANITNVKDLRKDLELEGIVTKITAYGVFVDVGVFQDGLIHLNLVKDKIGRLIKLGKVLKVKVVDVDKNKNRFGLALSELSKPYITKSQSNLPPEQKKRKPSRQATTNSSPKINHVFNTAMADALAKLKKGQNQ